MVWAALNVDQREAITEIQNSTSDRTVAVLGAAILDDSLRHALIYRMRPQYGEADINDKLFRVSGPLGNLGPKIDLGYQLYMFEKPIRNSMYGICDVRNLFAHSLRMSFTSEDTRLTMAFNKMKAHEEFKKYPTPATVPTDIVENTKIYDVEPILNRRSHFIVELKLTLMWLMGDWDRHYPNSNVTLHSEAAPST